MTGPTVAVLLTWHPDLGAPVRPVAVLGLDPHGEDEDSVLVWVPPADEAADAWRDRLAAVPVGHLGSALTDWAAHPASLACVLVTVQKTVALADAVTGVVDDLLAAVLPTLDGSGR